MKYLACFILFIPFAREAVNAQTITPASSDELCPNTEYTFTVTMPAGKTFSGIVSSNGSAVTQYPSTPVNGFLSFKGKFSDINQKQIFRLNYSDGSGFDFVFKKIKSLFYTNAGVACTQIRPNPTTITVPKCMVSTIQLTFTQVQYYTEFEASPSSSCFGSVTKYEYILPANWKLGTTLSNGVTPIVAGNNVSITTDVSTGGSVQIKPSNKDCPSAVVNNSFTTIIPVGRPDPVFTISPSSVQIQCTFARTETFTIQTTGTLACPISYTWDLGKDNHWKYNGLAAPATITTTTNSLTLTQESGTILPSNVKVTPVLNGVNQTELISQISWTTPSYGIVGGGNICTGTSQPFSVYNTTVGSTYSWSYTTLLPNYGASVVLINSQYSNQTTLTKIGDGVINLNVHLVNACQQQTDLTRINVKVGGYSQTSDMISGYMLAYPPCYTQLCTPKPVSSSIGTAGPYGTLVYGGSAYLDCNNDLQLYNTELEKGTWSLASGSVFYWYSGIGTHLTFYPSSTANLKFRLTQNNSCGNQYYDFNFYPTKYNGNGLQQRTGSAPIGQNSIDNKPATYIASPNPATNTLSISIDEAKLAAENIELSEKQNIKEISIINRNGVFIKKQIFGNHIRKTTIDISNLSPGYYILRIFDGANYTPLKFIKK
jgi:hypothetical protein